MVYRWWKLVLLAGLVPCAACTSVDDAPGVSTRPAPQAAAEPASAPLPPLPANDQPVYRDPEAARRLIERYKDGIGPPRPRP